MQITSLARIAQFRNLLQTELFPALESIVDILGKPARRLIAVVTMAPLERWIGGRRCATGRPLEDRVCIGTALLAKAIYQIPTTRQLLVRLQTDSQLRRLCGWDHAEQVPSEATFSRALAEFAKSKVFNEIHAALVRDKLQECEFDYLARAMPRRLNRGNCCLQRKRKPSPRRRRLKRANGNGNRAKKEGRTSAPKRATAVSGSNGSSI